MKKRPSEQNQISDKANRRHRKYDDEFKRQALTMVRNGQSVRSVADALGISENLIHRWRRLSRNLPSAAGDEVEQLRRQLTHGNDSYLCSAEHR